MIQFPCYPSINPFQYPKNVFYPAQPVNIGDELNRIHNTYYPDLTLEEFNASQPVRNDMLYKSGKLEQLAKYGSNINCGLTYNKVKDNNDFKELINSKYLNSTEGFVRIMKNLNSLEEQRQQKLTYHPSLYGINIQRIPALDYQKYDINDYLRILNDFTKNEKISDDLKEYILKMKADKLDIYYTKLDKLNSTDNPVKILSERISYSNE